MNKEAANEDLSKKEIQKRESVRNSDVKEEGISIKSMQKSGIRGNTLVGRGKT